MNATKIFIALLKNALHKRQNICYNRFNDVSRTWKYPLSILLFFSVFTSILGETGDSTKYLTVKDTLFVTVNAQTGEKIFEHRIQHKQTLYSLARFYGLNEEELYPYNPTLKSNKMPVNQVVYVPIPNAAIKRFKGDNFKRWKYAPIMFLVKKGDNLYNISKTLFHMPVDSVVKWNNLPNQTIAPGQRLLVGWMSLDGVPDTVRNLRKGTADVRSQMLGAYFSKQSKAIEERGAAFWATKGNSKTDLYCLHRTAKRGTIMAIMSMMNNKTVYAKVIGKMPDSVYGLETVIVVAPSVSKLLGAKDEKFFVKIRYIQK